MLGGWLQKRDFTVFTAHRSLLRHATQAGKEVTKFHHENLLIYSNPLVKLSRFRQRREAKPANRQRIFAGPVGARRFKLWPVWL